MRGPAGGMFLPPVSNKPFFSTANVLHQRLEFVVRQTFGRFHPRLAFGILEAFLQRLERLLISERGLHLGIRQIFDAEFLANLRVPLAFRAVTLDTSLVPILLRVRGRSRYCGGEAKYRCDN
jgi:hypothetical protein